ncbi:MAG: Asp23/Gls24 family envelope stress response protein [Chloroflexota bacterium]|nr:Asp23/Gls24 family envelope stress response protein [Chloroflexota bacterium]
MSNSGKEIITTGEEKSIEDRFQDTEMAAKIAELESGAEYTIGGETNISDEVIGSIAALAAREVEGIANIGLSSVTRTLSETFGGAEKKARGVKVEHGKKEAILDLSIQVVYGFSIPQIVVEVRKKVGAGLLEMAGLIAKEININITGIAFPEKMPGKIE